METRKMNNKTEQKKSSFETLNLIDVNSLTEEKNKLTYLNWAHAVRVLQMNYPEAKWEVKRFDGMPFLKTELGYFVEVELTVENKTLSQLHAVFDFRGKAILKPSVTDINNSIQRCLAKVIALHGLGLYIYAREDTPEIKNAELVSGSAASLVNNILAKKKGAEVYSTPELITPEQERLIKNIVLTPEFPDERVSKALGFYRVKGFNEMTFNQAKHFISRAAE